jgi:hypothetical protein
VGPVRRREEEHFGGRGGKQKGGEARVDTKKQWLEEGALFERSRKMSAKSLWKNNDGH